MRRDEETGWCSVDQIQNIFHESNDTIHYIIII